MTAVIKARGLTATLSAGKWRTENKILLRVIETLREMHVNSGADPNPEHSEAEFIAQKLGG